MTDPKYEEEVSGCTASVGIISKDKIYVVCSIAPSRFAFAYYCRQMLEIREPS